MPTTDTVRQVKLDNLPVDLRMLAVSFRRHLLAEDKSPRTVETYLGAVKVLGEFLDTHNMPTDPAAISREHLEEFIADQLARWKPATANNRYRALRAFWRWLDDEGEIESGNPFARMSPMTTTCSLIGLSSVICGAYALLISGARNQSGMKPAVRVEWG